MGQAGERLPEKMTTGVPGLDRILCGGLTRSGVFIVEGPPGAGKTILCNQLCFHRAAQREHSLYITLLAESHDVLMQHLGCMDFFDASLVPERLYYVSAFDTLMREGLTGIFALLRHGAKQHQAGLIVLDGLFVLEESINSDTEFRKFINDLNALAKLMGTTVVLLTNSSRRKPGIHPEHTMVDGWIELDRYLHDHHGVRSLVVHKYRGSDFLEGRHMLRISDSGVRVVPRLESVYLGGGRPPALGERLPSGVPGLDELIDGGLQDRSSTLVLGPTGVGKTLFGMQFVSLCSPQEPGLMVSFHEDEPQLLAKAERLGLPLEQQLKDGSVEVMWVNIAHHLVDEVAQEVLQRVERSGVRRLFVDGVDDFQEGLNAPERIRPFLVALWRMLKNQGVTAVYSQELPDVLGGETSLGSSTVSAFVENIVMLRYRQLDHCLQRTLGVLKLRDSDFDPRMYPFRIGQGGFTLGEPLSKEGC